MVFKVDWPKFCIYSNNSSQKIKNIPFEFRTPNKRDMAMIVDNISLTFELTSSPLVRSRLRP